MRPAQDLRALVVDDESLARELMSRMLNEAGVEVIGQAEQYYEALELVERLCPDVVFLDVRMPGINGIEAASLLSADENAPIVVMVTGHAEHAIDAFQGATLDYLLKPVSHERLALALNKIRKQLRLQRRAKQAELQRKVKTRSVIQRLSVRIKGGVRVIPFERILYATTSAKSVNIRLPDETLKTQHTLAQLEDLLPPNFFRTHASCIVNLGAIREIVLLGNHTYSVVLMNEEELPLARQHYPELQQRLGIVNHAAE